MALLGKLLKKGIKIRESLEQDFSSPIDLQKVELKKLLIVARHTAFGKFSYFDTILFPFLLMMKFMRNGGRGHYKERKIFVGRER